MKKIFYLLAVAAVQIQAATIELANLFGSGCVLQREQAVALWGTAQPNEVITVSVNGQSKNGTADGSGGWRVVLDSESAGGPYTLSVTGNLSDPKQLTEVYFGDVWLFTGQSNMERALVSHTQNDHPAYYDTVPNATDNFDDLRVMSLNNVSAGSPASQASIAQPWSRWEAGNLTSIPAAGYFFARKLNEALDANGQSNVPLGFIKTCKGATAAEQWMSTGALAGMSETLIQDGFTSSDYYNGNIAPLQDYAIKGVLWYQGEGNSKSIERSEQYDLLLKTLAESWRTEWGIDFPFYYVQLAAFQAYDPIAEDSTDNGFYINWAWIRESMTQVRSLISNSGMACIVDTGFQGDIHPPFKDIVGDRLFRIAANETYGIPTVFQGPTVSNVEITGSDVVITFDHVGTGLQRQAVDSQPDAEEVTAGYLGVSVLADELAGFTLCGADQIFYAATSAEVISANQIRISSAFDVSVPVAVRYAWQSYPRCNLFNSEGLPAEPFRTDSYAYGTSSSAISGPTLSYDLDTFTENAVNNGSIGNSLTLTLSKETFSADVVSGGHVSVANVPDGLTASFVRNSDTQMTMSLTGNATTHAYTDDISNLTVTFANAAFSGGNASAVIGSTRSDLTVNFIDPVMVLVGGSILNGNFNQPGTAGAVTFDAESNWVNMGGSGAVNFLSDAAANNLDGTHHSKLSEKWPTAPGLDTGHIIAEGDVFDLSYQWHDGWNWGAAQQYSVRLFVTDNNQIDGAQTTLVSVLSGTGINGNYDLVDLNAIYTASAAEAGKKLFVALEIVGTSPTGNAYVQMDNLELIVTAATPPANDADMDGLLDTWEIEQFGDLTTSSGGSDNYDGDHNSDRVEYLAGTSATDSNSYFKTPLIEAGFGIIEVSFNGISNRTYVLETSTVLSPSNGWNFGASIGPLPANGLQILRHTVPGNPPTLFGRIGISME